MIGRVPKTAEERGELAKQLLPYRLLWESEEFQKIWVGEVVGKDMEALKSLSYRVGDKTTQGQAKALALCGLPIPQGHEEMLRTFLAIRAVTTYFEKKLVMFKSYSDSYGKLESGERVNA